MAGTRLQRSARTAVWVVLAWVGSLLSLVFSGLDPNDPSPFLYLSLLGALTVPFLLIWRRRFPELVLVITVAASALLSFGAVTTWVALGSLVRHRRSSPVRDPWQWGGTAAVTAVTHLAVHRDFSSPVSERSLIGIFFDTPQGPEWQTALPWYTPLLLTSILMAMVLGVVSISRARAQASRARDTADTALEQNAHLNQEVARLEERERIARELHDGLGSTLAAVSMLSGAVQAQAHDAHAVASHAEQLQGVAREATTQMHEIVRTYRSTTHPVTSLGDIEDLIALSQTRGALIHADVDLTGTAAAPPAVHRACYRVVQELITNATKHAPNHTLTLSVTGAGPGVRVTASNPIPSGYGQVASTGGTGIIGAAERVEQLGGWLRTRVQDHHFVVEAWVPWS